MNKIWYNYEKIKGYKMLGDDIDKIIAKRKLTKAEILKEHEADIKKMIDNKIPLKIQIELILKNKILDKLDYREYYNILKKHFGYMGKKKTVKRDKKKVVELVREAKKRDENIAKNNTTQNLLKQDINMLEVAGLTP